MKLVFLIFIGASLASFSQAKHTNFPNDEIKTGTTPFSSNSERSQQGSNGKNNIRRQDNIQPQVINNQAPKTQTYTISQLLKQIKSQPNSYYAPGQDQYKVNNILGKDNQVLGKDNHIRGESNGVIGFKNDIHGNYNGAIGSDNRIRGSDNMVNGYGNIISGGSNQVQGYGNRVSGHQNVVNTPNNLYENSNRGSGRGRRLL